ncbi:helix-turn-helix domain-containing protein [Streptomyces bathyalis]|uniref:Helix-turn-helix domain-containing protein n=1 Tax=Streptomyces bathyalis TaxID=2710756 RepID=A0A7T1TAL8_9ACTN|nr:helix-turn-helix domain-containing protein [Streptomyces bathyalis]QPP09409.1 helix-turn-helix domain-containing protein [Streptomyces bathyalis]
MEQHAPSLRAEALALLRQGLRNSIVAERLGVPVGTVGWWLHEDRKDRGIVVERQHDCPRCQNLPIDGPAYSYLLGLYLGDGHIVAKHKQNHLSIYCCDGWPGLIAAAEDAMRKVITGAGTGRRMKIGCTEVKSYTKHWKCLFPQHGPGRKHERRIVLTDWQQEIVNEHPWNLVRGLIHSDGCRITNWTTRMVAGKRKRYEYPRYFFTNKSDDIRKIYTDTLDRVGVEWKTNARGSDPYHISVARRASVALMDAQVGPKY